MKHFLARLAIEVIFWGSIIGFIYGGWWLIQQ